MDAAFDAGDGGAISAEADWKSQIQSDLPTRARIADEDILRDYCLTCRMLVTFVRDINPSALRISAPVGMSYSTSTVAALAKSTAQTYLGTLAFVDHLAAAYHFQYAAIWNPSPFGDKLVGDEQKLVAEDWRLSDQKILLFLRKPRRFWIKLRRRISTTCRDC